MADERKLQWLRDRIADHCVEIEEIFTEPVEVTVLVRNPAHPDGERDVLVTSDDITKALAALRVVAERPEVKP